jgi:hypothetical protein
LAAIAAISSAQAIGCLVSPSTRAAASRALRRFVPVSASSDAGLFAVFVALAAFCAGDGFFFFAVMMLLLNTVVDPGTAPVAVLALINTVTS